MSARDPRPILVLNTGSSTFKWSLLTEDEQVIGAGSAGWEANDVRTLKAQIAAKLQSLPPCRAVGHRIVHGGTAFREPIVIDDEVRRALEALLPLDPLHMGVALCALDAAREVFSSVRHIAVFDTAFHGTLSAAARGYAVPAEWRQRWGVQRFGFHGISVSWSVGWVREHLRPFPARLIVAHLGSGCSVTAVLEGRSVDTSMGFTPLEGLMMGTRSGSIDPGVLFYLQNQHALAASELENALTYRSGLLGVSGVASDMRQVLEAAAAGNASAQLAYDMFVLYARRAVGAAAGVLGGADAIVFTGGVGEHQPRVRRDICAALPGVKIDGSANEGAPEGIINTPGSITKALVIGAREDLAMLREVRRLVPALIA